jgi:ABC-type lipoprotein export system ATPase subunit
MDIKVDNLYKSFVSPEGNPVHVLEACNLDVSSGEHVVIVGPSGVGKSTLLHILGLLDAPTSGEVKWGNKIIAYKNDHKLAKRRNRQIGFIFQNHYLLGECTVLENVLLPGLIFGKENRKVLHSKAADLLKEVGLENRATFYPRQLSGGEKQRVALCRALINEPELILADEITGNLDSTLKTEMMDILKRSTQAFQATLIAVTHDFSLLGYYDSIYKLADGKLYLENDKIK